MQTHTRVSVKVDTADVLEFWIWELQSAHDQEHHSLLPWGTHWVLWPGGHLG